MKKKKQLMEYYHLKRMWQVLAVIFSLLPECRGVSLFIWAVFLQQLYHPIQLFLFISWHIIRLVNCVTSLEWKVL